MEIGEMSSGVFDPRKHHRRSMRLQGYDYAKEGAYFVTLCVKNRERSLGEIIKCEMKLSAIGEIARKCWEEIPEHFKDAALDAFVIMPDHVHGIIILKENVFVGVQYIEPPHELNRYQKVVAGSISSIVRSYKAAVTRLCRREGHGEFMWQRNYYEHIVRDGRDLDRIRSYIENNVTAWAERQELEYESMSRDDGAITNKSEKESHGRRESAGKARH